MSDPRTDALTNQERADRAAVALNSYQVHALATLEFNNTADLLVHLLADLRHWAYRIGLDTEDTIEHSRNLFSAEVNQEEGR